MGCVELFFKSGWWTGRILTGPKNIDLVAAFKVLKENGFNVSYDPPPYGLVIHLDNMSVNLYPLGNLLVITKGPFEVEELNKRLTGLRKKLVDSDCIKYNSGGVVV